MTNLGSSRPFTHSFFTLSYYSLYILIDHSLMINAQVRYKQGRLTINNRNTHREFKLKFSALLKANDFKYAENSKK